MAVRNGIEAFVKKEVIPLHDANQELLTNQRLLYQPDGRFCDEVLDLISQVRRASAKAGFFNMCVPEEIGGAGMGLLAYYAAWERVFRLCGGHRWLATYAISHWAFGPSPILLEVTPRAREEMLEPMLRGEKSMCFGMSEPGAGSDVAMIQTRATRDGDGWRLNGRKIWITNGPYADYAIVFAITDPDRAAARKGGISAFLIPTDSPGLSWKTWCACSARSAGTKGRSSSRTCTSSRIR